VLEHRWRWAGTGKNDPGRFGPRSAFGVDHLVHLAGVEEATLMIGLHGVEHLAIWSEVDVWASPDWNGFAVEGAFEGPGPNEPVGGIARYSGNLHLSRIYASVEAITDVILGLVQDPQRRHTQLVLWPW